MRQMQKHKKGVKEVCTNYSLLFCWRQTPIFFKVFYFTSKNIKWTKKNFESILKLEGRLQFSCPTNHDLAFSNLPFFKSFSFCHLFEILLWRSIGHNVEDDHEFPKVNVTITVGIVHSEDVWLQFVRVCVGKTGLETRS